MRWAATTPSSQHRSHGHSPFTHSSHAHPQQQCSYVSPKKRGCRRASTATARDYIADTTPLQALQCDRHSAKHSANSNGHGAIRGRCPEADKLQYQNPFFATPKEAAPDGIATKHFQALDLEVFISRHELLHSRLARPATTTQLHLLTLSVSAQHLRTIQTQTSLKHGPLHAATQITLLS